MIRIAKEIGAEKFYTNGGSGQFLIHGEEAAREFGQRIQQEYNKETWGGATITFALQELPETIPEQDIKTSKSVHPYLRLLQFRLLCVKGYPHQEREVLPAHPLMRLCDACGKRYAEDKYEMEDRDPDDQERRYCSVCLRKRTEDHDIDKD
jgi:hypothetical protein